MAVFAADAIVNSAAEHAITYAFAGDQAASAISAESLGSAALLGPGTLTSQAISRVRAAVRASEEALAGRPAASIANRASRLRSLQDTLPNTNITEFRTGPAAQMSGHVSRLEYANIAKINKAKEVVHVFEALKRAESRGWELVGAVKINGADQGIDMLLRGAEGGPNAGRLALLESKAGRLGTKKLKGGYMQCSQQWWLSRLELAGRQDLTAAINEGRVDFILWEGERNQLSKIHPHRFVRDVRQSGWIENY